MARNEEKAMAMFNRWREAKHLELGLIRPKGEKRPGWISQITDLGECERWRHDVLRDINQKTAQIQNSTLGEYRLRELNDEINKLLRTKRAWEHQIRQLGGPDYIRASRVYDSQGRAIPASSYKYFGAAKELPGVKEQLEQDESRSLQKIKVKMDHLRERLDPDYFGFYDDDTTTEANLQLERLEAQAEKQLIDSYLREQGDDYDLSNEDTTPGYHENRSSFMTPLDFSMREDHLISDTDKEHHLHQKSSSTNPSTSTIVIPSQKEVEAYLVERRKQDLLDRYD